MVASMKEFSMSQQVGNRRHLSFDLCGPYVCDEIDSNRVRCHLQIAGANVAVDIPGDLLARHRQGTHGEIALLVPGNRMLPIETVRMLTEGERKTANAWSAEMEDFDRF
jgi:hypothetical protein